MILGLMGDLLAQRADAFSLWIANLCSTLALPKYFTLCTLVPKCEQLIPTQVAA